MIEDKPNDDKGTQCFECEGFEHIKAKCHTFLKKQKKGLLAPWFNYESEEETAHIWMAYSSLCEYDGESNTEEEDLDSYSLILSKWKETCVVTTQLII